VPLRRHEIDLSRFGESDFISPIAYQDLLAGTNDSQKPKRKEIPIGTNPVDVDGFMMRRATQLSLPERPNMELRFLGSRLDWSGDGKKLFVRAFDDVCIGYPDVNLLAVATRSESSKKSTSDVLLTVATSKMERFVTVRNHLSVWCIDLVQPKKKQVDGYRLNLRDADKAAMSPHGNILLINESRKLHVFEASDKIKKIGSTDAPDEVKSEFLANTLITTSPDGKVGMWLFRPYDTTQGKTIPGRLLAFSTSNPSKTVIDMELSFPALYAAYSPHHRLFFLSGKDGSFWKLDPTTKELRSMELLGVPTPIYEIDVNPALRCVACLGKDRLIFIE
jgi:hypothetical protein